MSKWFSVGDKLPKMKDSEVTVPVILSISDGLTENRYTTIGFYFMTEEEWYTDNGDLITDNVTHWHKIPKFKEGNNGI